MPARNDPNHIPVYVIAALEEVRADGRCNMLARARVMDELEAMYASAAHLWLRQHPARYLQAVTEMGEQRRQAQP